MYNVHVGISTCIKENPNFGCNKATCTCMHLHVAIHYLFFALYMYMYDSLYTYLNKASMLLNTKFLLMYSRCTCTCTCT